MGPAEISHKDGDEVVTTVDRCVEEALGRTLPALLAGSRVIGEEACSADAGLLATLGSGRVWLVDPIDGTRNFADGRPPFALMVALLEDGCLTASWIHDPLTGRMCVAELGSGAWVDGVRLRTDASPPMARAEGIVSRAFLPVANEAAADRLAQHVGAVHPTARCAGHEYPLVALGTMHFALYWRTLPWDHAAGTLFLREAGGSVTHLDGADYDPTSPRPGLLLAVSSVLAEELRAVLHQGEP